MEKPPLSLVHYLFTECKRKVEDRFVDSEGIRLELSRMQLNRKAEKGHPYSRPALCANFILDEVELTIADLRKKPLTHGYDESSFWTSFQDGIENVLGTLLLPEDYLREGHTLIDRKVGEQNVAKDEHEMQRQEVIRGEMIKRSEYFQDVLIKNPTGHKVIEEYIKLLRHQGYGLTPELQMPYVVMGAQFAQDMYERLYPLSGNLPPIRK